MGYQILEVDPAFQDNLKHSCQGKTRKHLFRGCYKSDYFKARDGIKLLQHDSNFCTFLMSMSKTYKKMVNPQTECGICLTEKRSNSGSLLPLLQDMQAVHLSKTLNNFFFILNSVLIHAHGRLRTILLWLTSLPDEYKVLY